MRRITSDLNDLCLARLKVGFEELPGIVVKMAAVVIHFTRSSIEDSSSALLPSFNVVLMSLYTFNNGLQVGAEVVNGGTEEMSDRTRHRMGLRSQSFKPIIKICRFNAVYLQRICIEL